MPLIAYKCCMFSQNARVMEQTGSARLCPTAYINKIASYETQISTTLYNDQKCDQRAFDAVQRHWSGLILNQIVVGNG